MKELVIVKELLLLSLGNHPMLELSTILLCVATIVAFILLVAFMLLLGGLVAVMFILPHLTVTPINFRSK